MSTYSSNLRLELITTGTQAGTWGTTTNTNLGTLIEGSVAGFATVVITSTSQALTANNGAADESRLAMLQLTTSGISSAFAVYAPPATKQYTIYNSSSYTATLYNSTVLGNTTAAGTGVAIPSGATMTVWSNGTSFFQQNTYLNSPTFVTPVLGTPASGTLTNCTGLPVGSVTGLGTGVGTFLTTPSSANLAAAVTGETGSGALVFGTAPTLTGATMAGDLALGAYQLTTTNFTVVESGGKLIIKYGGTTILSISSTGAIIAAGAVTGVGTP
jgi:hypothetical protein